VDAEIETCFEVTIRLTLEKERKIAWSRGETADDIFTIGNARPLDHALQHATTEMAMWLRDDYGLAMWRQRTFSGRWFAMMWRTFSTRLTR
jgi:acetamidase/formamidase